MELITDNRGRNPENGQFVKGNRYRSPTSNPLGRQYREMRAAFFKAANPEQLEALTLEVLAIAHDRQVEPRARLAAAELIFAYAYGRPKESLSVDVHQDTAGDLGTVPTERLRQAWAVLAE